MTPITTDRDITRGIAMKSIRVKSLLDPWMSEMVRLTELKTPMPSRISQSTATITTNAMPIATLTRNEIFMTDHGSTRATVSRTRRPVGAGAAGRGAGAAFLAAGWAAAG